MSSGALQRLLALRATQRVTATEFVIALQQRLSRYGVTTLRFVKFRPQPPAEERVGSRARARDVITEWLRHYKPGRRRMTSIPCGNMFERQLAALVARERNKRQSVGICSECTLRNGEVRHIPMMDFRCRIAQRNQELLVRGLQTLKHRGMLFNSGRSYHFYGYRLMTEREWVYFQGQCLLLGRLADSRYVGHRILEGMCTLRLTGDDRLKPRTPTSVAVV